MASMEEEEAQTEHEGGREGGTDRQALCCVQNGVDWHPNHSQDCATHWFQNRTFKCHVEYAPWVPLSRISFNFFWWAFSLTSARLSQPMSPRLSEPEQAARGEIH